MNLLERIHIEKKILTPRPHRLGATDGAELQQFLEGLDTTLFQAGCPERMCNEVRVALEAAFWEVAENENPDRRIQKTGRSIHLSYGLHTIAPLSLRREWQNGFLEKTGADVIFSAVVESSLGVNPQIAAANAAAVLPANDRQAIIQENMDAVDYMQNGTIRLFNAAQREGEREQDDDN